MCGIVGYLGPKNSIEVVLEGLRRLEYRGYDSAGICFKNSSGNLSLFKKAGKLENLKNELVNVKDFATSCIGHTRWATHGEVNDRNAHPHTNDSMAIDEDCSIAIVHNGIIENAMTLKDELIGKGIVFKSETDSEVFLGLIVYELNSNPGIDYIDAIVSSFKKIRGNSAFVIEIKDVEGIISLKKGAPLVCGTNESMGEVLVSSDPYALVGMADTIYFPEDDVICILSKEINHLRFVEFDGSPSNRFITKKQEITLQTSEKGQFEHFMLKEIYEQPELIRKLDEYYTSNEGFLKLKEISALRPERIQITACGTAWHAGLVVKNYFEKFARIPTNIELASEFRYKDPIIGEKELVIFISQSGETADTLAAQALCKKRGIKTLSIVNVEGSTLFRSCDHNLLIYAGVEIGVASTKAFTLQSLTGRLLTHALSNDLEKSKDNNKFKILAERIDNLLAGVETIRSIAMEIYNYKGFIFTGRGEDFPVALEGALKLKEIAYVHAEGYASGELKHGPIALIDEFMVNIAIVTPKLYEKSISNLQEVKARRGIIVTIGPENDKQLKSISDYYIPLNYEGLEELIPLYTNVANQLLAYYMAKFKGTDIDKPRNLAKSVTVE